MRTFILFAVLIGLHAIATACAPSGALSPRTAPAPQAPTLDLPRIFCVIDLQALPDAQVVENCGIAPARRADMAMLLAAARAQPEKAAKLAACIHALPPSAALVESPPPVEVLDP